MGPGVIYGLSVQNQTDEAVRFDGNPSRNWYSVHYLAPYDPAQVRNFPEPGNPPSPVDAAFEPVPIGEVDQDGLDAPGQPA